MKCILVIVAGLMLAPFSFPEDQASSTPRFFKVPANTAMRVRTMDEISSETAHVGDDVQMEVLGDVIELPGELLNRAPGSQVRLGYVFRSATSIPADGRSTGALIYYPKEIVVILAAKH